MYKSILISTDNTPTIGDIVMSKFGDIYILTKNDSKQYKNFTIKQDIILIDTEAKIIKGDWYYDCESMTVLQCDIDQIKAETCSKVLSTTSKEVDLPQLSPQSIQLFIIYYNEHKCMPESVEVEKIDTTRCVKCKQLIYHYRCKCGEAYNYTVQKEIKLNPQNEVDITIFEIKNEIEAKARNYAGFNKNVDPNSFDERYYQKQKCEKYDAFKAGIKWFNSKKK